MKNTLLTICMFAGLTSLFAQIETTSYWTKKGNTSLNFSQSQLTNWSAGGQSSLTALGLFNYSFNYKKDKHIWDNSLNLALGYSHLGDEKFMKTDDRIEFNSLYGKNATEKLFYSTAFSFKTQFVDGFDYKVDSTTPISGFFAPAYVTLGLGLEYKPYSWLSMNFSPLTARLTFVTVKALSDSGDFGVDPGKQVRFELGMKAWVKMEKEIFKNVTLSSKLELFSDYLKNPERIDVDWQASLNMKVNKWLSANISGHMIYDDDIMITDKEGKKGPRTQFKEVLSIGLSYNF